MNIKEIFKPSKLKIIASVITLFISIIHIIYPSTRSCCAGGLICKDHTASHHHVTNLFPGSFCCQICATNIELIGGYIYLIFIYIIIPIIIIYSMISFIEFLIKKNKIFVIISSIVNLALLGFALFVLMNEISIGLFLTLFPLAIGLITFFIVKKAKNFELMRALKYFNMAYFASFVLPIGIFVLYLIFFGVRILH
ncbi:MAG: hypothetical protein ACQESF_04540 [Nanobdellota archaeon]